MLDEDYPPKKMLLPETLPVAGKPSRPRTRSLLEDAIANGKAMQNGTHELSKTGDFRAKVWDEQSSSWEVGKSPHSRARQEYFGTSALFPLGDPKTTVRTDYNTSTGQYGVTKEARPQTALVDLHTKVVEMRKSTRELPTKSHVTFIPQQQGNNSKDMRWAGIDANSMLRNSTPNTRTRWNRNASSIAWYTTSLPLSQYSTTSGSESDLVVGLAKQAGYYKDPDDDKKSYVGDGRKRRTDTMVSGDAPAWFQMKHIPVRKLNSTQLSTLLDWNAPIPTDHVKPGLLKIFGIGDSGAGGAEEPHPDLADSKQFQMPSIPAAQHKTNPPKAKTSKPRR